MAPFVREEMWFEAARHDLTFLVDMDRKKYTGEITYSAFDRKKELDALAAVISKDGPHCYFIGQDLFFQDETIRVTRKELTGGTMIIDIEWWEDG